MKCEECGLDDSLYVCGECDQALCVACDEALHKGGKRKTHVRPLVCGTCRSNATTRCDSCNISACEKCGISHKDHKSEILVTPKVIGVFWDITSCKPSRAEDIKQALNEITQRVGITDFVRTYGDPWGRWKEASLKEGIIPVFRQGIKDIEAMLLDISVLANTGLTHVLIINSQISLIKPHLVQLKLNLKNIEFILSNRILPLTLETLNEACPPKLRSREDRFSEVKAINHDKTIAIDQISEYLKEEAHKGNLLHEVPDLIEKFRNSLKTSSDSVIKLIKTAEKKNVIHLILREFGDVVLEYASLKIEDLSLEILVWTLRSLKNDEMLPTEKAIQCRIREIFDLKPNVSQWDHLIQKARGHSHSSSAPVEFSLFSQTVSNNLPKFSIREISDPTNGSKTLLIYPSGEEWVALDQNSKSGDYLSIKDTEDWKELLQFLEEYFVNKKTKKIDDEIRAIPGGRYGCAQLIKLCGPIGLRNCSLGKISYMVQMAINEDLLRYQRTLLVWTPSHQRSASKVEIHRKIVAIEKAILDHLEAPPYEISLAQLPLLLKRTLKFQLNISELGFAKLKDLLLSIGSVAVELRGTNHPFVILKTVKIAPPSADVVLDLILQILNENKFGLSELKLEPQLLEKLDVSWPNYSVSSLVEFIQVYGKNSFEIVQTKNTYMIFKAENPNSYYSPFRDSFGSAMLEKTQPEVLHSRQFSSGYENNSISNDIFSHGHMQRIVNISNLPMQMEKPSHQPEYFYDTFYDVSTDLSSSLQGFSFFSHSRSDSVKINPHNRTQSDNPNENVEGKHTRLHYSGFDVFDLRPPPGFE